ncbi:MAG: chemotaxis protein CheW [Verrucomicrobiota bacterium]
MSERQLVTFYVGGEFFGIDILLVKEINRKLQLTHVDRVAPYIAGLINLRGQIVTILELAKRLNIETDSTPENCIILKTSNEIDRRQISVEGMSEVPSDFMGLLVDRIGDVITVDTDNLEDPPRDSHSEENPFFDKVAQLDGSIIIILNLQNILSAELSTAAV